MLIQPYLTFNGNCEEAFKFYEKALGGKIEMLMRFKDMPPQDGGDNGCGDMSKEAMAALAEKVMHVSLSVGNQMIMASDNPPNYPYQGIHGMSISLGFDSPAEGEKVFKALSEGATITMPLAETFWAERFGMLTDRFGVHWMINAEGKKKFA